MTSVHSPFDIRVFEKECRSLARLGYDVHLVAQHTHDEIVDGVHVWHVPATESRLRRLLGTAAAVYKRALDLKGSLYHFHDPELLPWAVRLHRKTGAPVIYDSHEYLTLDIRYKPYLPRAVSFPLSAFVSAVEKLCVRRLSGIVAVNSYMEEGLRSLHDNIGVVANYPPLSFGAEGDGAGLPEPDTAVFNGPMDVSRGFRTIFETMQIVRRVKPNATCHVFGEFQRHRLPGYLNRYREEEFAQFGVELKPRVPHEQMASMLKRYAVGWIPSRWQPSFFHATPIKLIEFMALGMPVVGSDLPVMKAIIEDTNCGIAVKAEDPEAHAEGLLRIWNDPALAARFGESGRRAARDRYNWEQQLPALITIYERAWKEMENGR